MAAFYTWLSWLFVDEIHPHFFPQGEFIDSVVEIIHVSAPFQSLCFPHPRGSTLTCGYSLSWCKVRITASDSAIWGFKEGPKSAATSVTSAVDPWWEDERCVEVETMTQLLLHRCFPTLFQLFVCVCDRSIPHSAGSSRSLPSRWGDICSWWKLRCHNTWSVSGCFTLEAEPTGPYLTFLRSSEEFP